MCAHRIKQRAVAKQRVGGGWQKNSVQPLVSGRPVLSLLAGKKNPLFTLQLSLKAKLLTPHREREFLFPRVLAAFHNLFS